MADSGAASRIGFLRERLAGRRRRYEEIAIRRDELRSPDAALLGVGWTPAAGTFSHLNDDEAVIEYQVTADSLLIFVGRRDGLTLATVPLPPGGLQGRVRLARELMARRDSVVARALPVLGALGDLLIAPVRRAGALQGIRVLLLIPDGILTYLPFAALVDSETGRYLVQDYILLTLPSAGSLVALREAPGLGDARVPGSALAPLPEALPGTAPEARTVARALQARFVLGGRASEVAVRASLAAGGVVHLATHGELNSRNPMFSHLATAPGRGDQPADDGRLEVHEILGLSVPSPLVFLSGCETGLGAAWNTAFTPGEDFATLARAFHYAGARNVIATLWRVDDQGAVELAARFYQHFPGVPAAEALASAQREVLGAARWGAPYYWAGYVLSGEGGTGGRAKKDGTLSVK